MPATEVDVADGVVADDVVDGAVGDGGVSVLPVELGVVVGAAVILADPIFQGLAIALMAGEIASLFISRMAVPVLYFMANKHSHPEPSH